MLIYDASLSTLRNLQHYWYLHGGGETHMCGQSLYRRRCLPWGGFFLESLCIIQANASGYLVFSPLFPSRPLSDVPYLPIFLLPTYPPSSHCSSFIHCCLLPLCSCDAFDHISICECSAKCTCAGLSAEISGSHLYFGHVLVTRFCSVAPKTGCSF